MFHRNGRGHCLRTIFLFLFLLCNRFLSVGGVVILSLAFRCFYRAVYVVVSDIIFKINLKTISKGNCSVTYLAS
jgi:hypothetical protein